MPANTSEFHRFSALALRDLLARGELSPTEVTRAFLDEAIARNEFHGAFSAITETQAMERARQLERERGSNWKSTADLSPLWGLPHADKDLERRTGVPTGYGSAAGGQVPDTSDDAVELADALGTVSLGKTSTSEFGLFGYTEPVAGVPARHPQNSEYGAGGSSGGAASAVAAGLLPVAIGSDGGGSIRVPAATVGIVGLKPTRGAIPIDQERDTPTGVVHGPLARNVADAKLLFTAMRETRPHRRAGSARGKATGEAKAKLASIPDLRFAWALDSPWNPTYKFTPSRANRQALLDALEILRQLGAGQPRSEGNSHSIMEISLADPAYGETFTGAWMRAAASLPSGIPLDQVEPLTRHLIQSGRALTRQQIEQNQADCAAYRRRILDQLADIDVLVTPCLGLDPLPIGSFPADPEANFAKQSEYSPYTSWVNLAGLPALTLPVGVYELENGKTRLPFNVQLVAVPGQDDLLLSIGQAMERLVGTLERPVRDPGDAWAITSSGQKLWGRFGAAGLLLWDPRENTVLLQLRATGSHHGGTWGIPGGARHWHEPALDAALREAAEEAGVPANLVRPLSQHVLQIETWSYTTVVAEATQSFTPRIQDWESTALEWVPVESVPQLPLHPGFGNSWPHLREKLGK